MEIVYYVAASLDGYIATRQGCIDWLQPFEQSDEDYGYGEFYASFEAVLLGGSRTRSASSFRPYAGKPYWFSRGNGNTSQKGRGRDEAPWHSARVARGRRQAGRRVPRARTHHPAHRVGDSYRPGEALKLLGTNTHASGIVQLRYARFSP